MKNCIFCKILAGEVEASFVLKGTSASAFMDINPINKGHVLIIPNEHHERFSSVDASVAGDMFKMAQDCLRAIEKTDIVCEGANIFLSDGEVAGQEVPHSHLHIAPRFAGDGHRMGFSGTDGKESDRARLDSTAKEIREQLSL